MVISPKYSFIQFGESIPQNCCVALPVSRISDLAFYVYTNFKFKIGIRNSSGQVMQDAMQTKYDWFGCVDGKDAEINLDGILSCGECFNLVLLGSNNVVRAVSNTFQYLCDSKYTSTVQYSLDGPGFERDCPTCLNRVRLPLYLTEPQYSQEQEVYTLKSGYRRHLSAEIGKTYNLKTDFLPDELHQKLVIALSHDEVHIDGILLTKSEAYNIDWGNTETINGVKYAMASAGMVENVTTRNDNCDVCGEISITGTVRFMDYVCQLGSGGWSESTLPTLPGVSGWRLVAYGDGRFVAVAYDRNKAAYSTDGGATWTESTLPVSGTWASIAYGDGKFVVVENDGNVAAYSSDGGATWQTSTLPGSDNWVAVAYGGGRFVAVAHDSDKAAYSTDGGATWLSSTLPNTAGWNGIAYGGYGRFVVVADDSNIVTCSDYGDTWLLTTGLLPGSAGWTAVAFGDGRFIAVASNSKLAHSEDSGETWTETTPPSSDAWTSAAYGGNGRFVVVAYSSNKAAYSTDGGATWLSSTLPGTAEWTGIAFGDGKFVAVAYDSGKVAYGTPQLTGRAFATAAMYERYVNGEFVGNVTESLLTDVTPVLTLSQYQLLSESDVERRVERILESFDLTADQELNEAIIDGDCSDGGDDGGGDDGDDGQRVMGAVWKSDICQISETVDETGRIRKVATGWVFGMNLEVTIAYEGDLTGEKTEIYMYDIRNEFIAAGQRYQALTTEEYSYLSLADARSRSIPFYAYLVGIYADRNTLVQPVEDVAAYNGLRCPPGVEVDNL
jgi:hypothetical protein